MKQFILKKLYSEIVTHVSTTWELSGDPDFSNVIMSVTASVANKEIWFVNISQLPDTELYVRAKRHFDNGEDSDWIKYSEVISSVLDVNYSVNESGIEVPMLKGSVVVDMEATKIRISLSEIRPKIVGHKATNYIIKNMDNAIVYRSMKNIDDKVVLNIDYTKYNITPYEPLKLMVSYINDNNVQSQFTEYDIIPNEIKLSVPYKLEDIIPDVDHTINITNPDDEVFNLYIKDLSSSDTIFESLQNDDNTISIPRFTLQYSKTYELILTNMSDEILFVDKLITNNRNDIYNLKENGFTLKFESDYKRESEISIPNDVTSYYIEGIENKVALTYSEEHDDFHFSKIFKDSINSYTSLYGLGYSISNDRITMVRTNGNTVCMAVYDDEALTYKLNLISYNTYFNTINVYKVKDLEDISMNTRTGVKSIFYNGYDKHVYFIGIVNDGVEVVSIYKYDYVNDLITKVVELLDQDCASYVFEIIADNQFLITGTGLDSNTNPFPIYVFNNTTNAFDNVGVMDSDYSDSILAPVKLRSGDIYLADTVANGLDYLIFDTDTLSLSTQTKNIDYEEGNKILALENGNLYINQLSDNEKYNYFGQ